MKIRPELASDYRDVNTVLMSAFPGDGESRLVTRLRDNASPFVSLVAERDGQLVGHILFSPVTLDSDSALKLMGLAPMAVHPEHQRCGIGKALIEAGLQKCKEIQAGAVVVLGHPEYYPKFGFVPSGDFHIRCEYDVPSEAFMLKELQPGYLSGRRGTIRYHEEFNAL